MYKRELLTFILLLSFFSVFSQDKDFNKFEIKSGVGLFVSLKELGILSPDIGPRNDRYADIRVGNPRNGRNFWYGRSTWVQFSYRWNKKYQAYVAYYHNPYKIPYNDPLGLWWEIDEKQVYHSIRAGVNRIFHADGKFTYKVGLGLVYNMEVVQRAAYHPYVSGTLIIPVADYAEDLYGVNPGIDLNFDTEYNISKTAVFGMRFNTYYLYQLGIDGVTISPFISVRF